MATVTALREEGVYERLEQAGARVENAMISAAEAAGVTLTVQRVGSMLTPFFGSGPVRNWDDSAACDGKLFGAFHRALLAEGVHWPPSQFEAGFVSLAHDDAVLERTEKAMKAAFAAL